MQMVKMNAIIAGTAAAILLVLIAGQSPVHGDEGYREGGGGYFMVGQDLLNIDNLNSRFEDSGYHDFSGNFISLGGGGHGVHGRLIIGGEGHGLIGTESYENVISEKKYDTSITAGFGFFNIGYEVFSTGNLGVYPLIGLGGGGLSIFITEKGVDTFDEVLEEPGRGSILSTGGFLLTRISHQEPTAKAYKPMSTALRLKNVLNILQVCLRAFSFARLVSMGLYPFS